jgi:hypothetical protein
MGWHDPFEYLKHKFWPKERLGVKLPIWPPTTKSQELLWFLYMQVVCHILLESSRWRLQLCFNLTSIEGLHTKLWASKITRVLISRFPVEAPRQNDIWVLAPWPSTKNTIRGKVMASPKSKPWWVLWVRACMWLVHAPKMFSYVLTNLLFSLCMSVWVINLLVNLPSPHPGALTHPFTPEMLRAKERAPISSPCIVFTLGFAVESIKEFASAS